MLAHYFEAGGPLMYAVLAAWVVVLAGCLDRGLYAAGRAWRRPARRVAELARGGRAATARALALREHERASRGLARIESVSQLATSIGLFGTVVGIAHSFFARGGEFDLAAPEALAAGLATALFTTVAGLVVFLFGQTFVIAYAEWLVVCERGSERLLEEAPAV